GLTTTISADGYSVDSGTFFAHNLMVVSNATAGIELKASSTADGGAQLTIGGNTNNVTADTTLQVTNLVANNVQFAGLSMTDQGYPFTKPIIAIVGGDSIAAGLNDIHNAWYYWTNGFAPPGSVVLVDTNAAIPGQQSFGMLTKLRPEWAT